MVISGAVAQSELPLAQVDPQLYPNLVQSNANLALRRVGS
jgi:hypothetical protein